MVSTVWLKSGTECKVLAEYKEKYWLVAKDGSWGPGTIENKDVRFTKPAPYFLNKAFVTPDTEAEHRLKEAGWSLKEKDDSIAIYEW